MTLILWNFLKQTALSNYDGDLKENWSRNTNFQVLEVYIIFSLAYKNPQLKKSSMKIRKDKTKGGYQK